VTAGVSSLPISQTLMTRPAWVVRASLRSQRLKPYERFADMIDRHWDGIAADCRPENRVSLDFVLACSTRYDPPKLPTRIPEEPSN
jgi:hypothetical protein